MFDGIATGSLMDVLGLQDGDVPRTVNGYDVATIEGVLAARTALGSATSLTVVVQRGSRSPTLEYFIE